MAEFPLPDVAWPPTREFWEGAARGELRIPRCTRCSAYCWYPADACRHCGADDLSWTTMSGRGTLFSFAVVRRALVKPFAARVPYATGLVSLEEDPSVRIVTIFVDCDPEALEVGLAVEVTFRALALPDVEGEVVAPFFRPTM
jgi:uncharacterized OB-fold protein